MNQSFSRKSRIRASRDFREIFQSRRAVRNRELTLYYRPIEDSTETRLGLSVGRRLGNAVARNRIKRTLREVFRRQRGELSGTFDLVAIPRSAASGSSVEAMTSAFLHLVRKIDRKEGDS